ncbi:MAG: endonuclease/exonuclease/phosphatase family protein [Conexibacter sp.]|nr:endonuclease/exonuclease/phosphatase family protein [Conexibacter sp.]
MRVLTWNLFHGRSVPERRHALLGAFTDMISGWEWDVALLQEVPPWWPPALAAACGADERTVLTSRNALLPLRRAIAERRPDLIKANGGGANAILVRGEGIAEHASLRLRFRPERRVLHAVRLAESGLWVANVHATANPKPLARADAVRCGETLARWAGAAPVLLGGDLNVPDPEVPGFADAGGHRIDRFYTRGALTVATPPRTLPRDGLSDHAPVLIELRAS